MKRKSLTIVSPVYNEEDVIEAFYIKLSQVLLTLADHYDTHMLFVIDKGNDQTFNILKRIGAKDANVKLIALSSRFGHQMSLLAGIDHCSSDIIIMMDSDLQHPPELIPELLEKYKQGYDIVYTIRKDAPETNFYKRVTSHFFL